VRALNLVVLHHHFRPGGVRRVIELATPHLVAHWPERVREVVLATGEAPDETWLVHFRDRLPGVRVRVRVEPAFGYASEMRLPAKTLRERVRDGLEALLREVTHDNCLIWAHNLGLGRNLYLARDLTFACHVGGPPLILHHHDWWFENRWHLFAAMCEPGFRKLDAVASAILTSSPNIAHAAINQADAAVLEKHLPGLAGWLPNPVEPEPPPPPARVAAARAWLREQLGEDAPVWLLPCRLLRRKNIAEALLLTRWLRPEAWLVTTAGVSSAEEQPYADALESAARTHGWRLRLGMLQSDESGKPSVPELLAASEAVLLTSLQEGFGLPYLEAAAAGRPLLARLLPNVAPDLAQFGFEFPQRYREVLVDPTLFDWRDERRRQKRMFADWRDLMPRAASQLAGTPALLAAGATPSPAPFSRLTLAAQLDVLARPLEVSWARCVGLNPFLKTWRERAATGQLKASPWPREAKRWLGGQAYARRFLQLAPPLLIERPRPRASQAAQMEFLRKKLRAENLYPLLWSPDLCPPASDLRPPSSDP
jgi:glycosyltransferase involved in cell wall biosynthesis